MLCTHEVIGSTPIFSTSPATCGKRFFDILKRYLFFKLCKTKKVMKSVWWMPWLSEVMKDVISCDKPRGGANNFRSVDFRMGQPGTLKRYHPDLSGD